MSSSEPGDSRMPRLYTAVIVVEALVIAALWAFERAFTR
jgi:hypothetical protein